MVKIKITNKLTVSNDNHFVIKRPPHRNTILFVWMQKCAPKTHHLYICEWCSLVFAGVSLSLIHSFILKFLLHSVIFINSDVRCDHTHKIVSVKLSTTTTKNKLFRISLAFFLLHILRFGLCNLHSPFNCFVSSLGFFVAGVHSSAWICRSKSLPQIANRFKFKIFVLHCCWFHFFSLSNHSPNLSAYACAGDSKLQWCHFFRSSHISEEKKQNKMRVNFFFFWSSARKRPIDQKTQYTGCDLFSIKTIIWCESMHFFHSLLLVFLLFDLVRCALVAYAILRWHKKTSQSWTKLKRFNTFCEHCPSDTGHIMHDNGLSSSAKLSDGKNDNRMHTKRSSESEKERNDNLKKRRD